MPTVALNVVCEAHRAPWMESKKKRDDGAGTDHRPQPGS